MGGSGTKAVLAALEARGSLIHEYPTRWTATCPAHPDTNPSLSLCRGEDGRVLVHCFAGCATRAVVDALGLSMDSLFSDRSTNEEAVYVHEDEDGGFLAEKIRYPGKRFAWRTHDPQTGTVPSLNGLQPPLYDLPEVLKAVAAGERVLLAEGEKDADALLEEGVIATCNPDGAGRWRAEYTGALKGADVVVVADRDAAGFRHVARVRTLATR